MIKDYKKISQFNINKKINIIIINKLVKICYKLLKKILLKIFKVHLVLHLLKIYNQFVIYY